MKKICPILPISKMTTRLNNVEVGAEFFLALDRLNLASGNVIIIPDVADELVCLNHSQRLCEKIIDADENVLCNIRNDNIAENADISASKITNMTISVQTRTDQWVNNSWTRMATFVYQGSDATGPILKAIAIAYGTGGYSLRIYDKTHQAIIASADYTNTVEETVNLGTIANLPADESVFELQGKRNGGSRFYCSSVDVFL